MPVKSVSLADTSQRGHTRRAAKNDACTAEERRSWSPRGVRRPHHLAGAPARNASLSRGGWEREHVRKRKEQKWCIYRVYGDARCRFGCRCGGHGGGGAPLVSRRKPCRLYRLAKERGVHQKPGLHVSELQGVVRRVYGKAQGARQGRAARVPGRHHRGREARAHRARPVRGDASQAGTGLPHTTHFCSLSTL
jgi:hypothetical protein